MEQVSNERLILKTAICMAGWVCIGKRFQQMSPEVLTVSLPALSLLTIYVGTEWSNKLPNQAVDALSRGMDRVSSAFQAAGRALVQRTAKTRSVVASVARKTLKPLRKRQRISEGSKKPRKPTWKNRMSSFVPSIVSLK